MSESLDRAEIVKRYVQLVATGSADDLTEMYTTDATIEDPVGSEIRRGRDAIHEFYSVIAQLDRDSELVHTIVAGGEVAFFWKLYVTGGGTRTRMDVIDVMTFSDDGKISSMRAFWSPTDIVVL